MFKFLRKYNKMLLAIFGVLLMITFLIPQAFDRFSQQAGARSGTIATVGDGEKVSAHLWEQYQREVGFLKEMHQRMGPQFPPLPGLGAIDRPEHWFLLVREAADAGVVPVHEIPAEQMQQLMTMTSEHDPEIIEKALEHFDGVRQLLDLYTTGDIYSDRRLRAEAGRLLHMVTARLVVVEPDAEKSALQPTEQQIEEHMKKYADKLAGQGEFGFGYKLPDRVKLEWLKVPAASVRAIVEQSPEMDPVQQRLHWKRNPNQNLIPYPADGSAPAIPPAVREDLLKQLTKAQLERIAKDGTDMLRLAQRGLPEKEGYLVLPADWTSRQKPLPQLGEEVRTRFPGLDLPEYSARGEKWLTFEELPALPGIGGASTDKLGSTPVNFTDLVKAAHEFGKPATYLVQKGVAAPAVRDAEDNLYFFRITDVDASRQPASVDEVREQVVKDLKRQDDYNRVKGSLANLETVARAGGLLQAAIESDTVVQPATGVYLWSEYWIQMLMQYRMPMIAQPSSLPVVGTDRKTIEAIVDRSLTLPQDQPASALTAEQKIFAVASDDKLAVVVVEITTQTPLSKQSFDRLAQAGAIQGLISAEELELESDAALLVGSGTDPDAKERNPIAKAFGFDVLAKRNAFAFKRDGDADATEEETGAAETTKTASVN